MTKRWDGKPIAVIVYDNGGANALCGIKEAGGITISQKLETAIQPDMLETAIASGCIDFCTVTRKYRSKTCAHCQE